MRHYRRLAVALAALLLLSLLSYVVGSSSSADLSVEAAKLSISSIDGSSRLSESFTLEQGTKLSKPFTVESDEVVRLSFTLKDGQGEKLSSEKMPHQIVVSMTDDVDDDESVAHTSIVSVKRSSGKASWNQRIDRLPASLVRQAKSGKVRIALLVGSFGSPSPVRVPLITVQLPAALLSTHADVAIQSLRARREAQEGFHRHADRHHTFAVPAAEQMPPRFISFFSALVTFFLPWIVLLALWSRILPSINVKAPSPVASPFYGSLIALELLAFLYWQGLGLTLFKMLPWLLVFSILSVHTGRKALGELQRIRLGRSA